MAELHITSEGGVFVDLPKPYDFGQVETVRDALTALFPHQEVRVLVGGTTATLSLNKLPGRRTSAPAIHVNGPCWCGYRHNYPA